MKSTRFEHFVCWEFRQNSLGVEGMRVKQFNDNSAGCMAVHGV